MLTVRKFRFENRLLREKLGGAKGTVVIFPTKDEVSDMGIPASRPRNVISASDPVQKAPRRVTPPKGTAHKVDGARGGSWP